MAYAIFAGMGLLFVPLLVSLHLLSSAEEALRRDWKPLESAVHDRTKLLSEVFLIRLRARVKQLRLEQPLIPPRPPSGSMAAGTTTTVKRIFSDPHAGALLRWDTACNAQQRAIDDKVLAATAVASALRRVLAETEAESNPGIQELRATLQGPNRQAVDSAAARYNAAVSRHTRFYSTFPTSVVARLMQCAAFPAYSEGTTGTP